MSIAQVYALGLITTSVSSGYAPFVPRQWAVGQIVHQVVGIVGGQYRSQIRLRLPDAMRQGDEMQVVIAEHRRRGVAERT